MIVTIPFSQSPTMQIIHVKHSFWIPGVLIICVPLKGLFTSYRFINGGIVLVGNIVACKTVGIWTMQMNMHDEIVRTLTNV